MFTGYTGKPFHVKGKGKGVEARVVPTKESAALVAATNEKVAASWFLLKTLVAERVDDLSARILYEQKVGHVPVVACKASLGF